MLSKSLIFPEGVSFPALIYCEGLEGKSQLLESELNALAVNVLRFPPYRETSLDRIATKDSLASCPTLEVLQLLAEMGITPLAQDRCEALGRTNPASLKSKTD